MIAEIQDGSSAVFDSWREAWTPKRIPAAADWCSETLRFSPDVEASAGRYNLDERPYWRVILDAFDDPEIDQIVVKKSTQVGGTVTLWAHMLFKAMHRPAPCMVVLPDRDSAIEFRDRVYNNALENPSTRNLVPPKREWNTRYIDLTTMRVYLAWSGSAQKLRMRACQTVYLSEVDVFGSTPGSRGGDPNKAAAERTKSFYQKQLYRESSPTAEPSTIAAEYEQTNQGHWFCPCPKCGKYQVLRFFPKKVGENAGKGGVMGVTDKQGQLVEPEIAEKEAYYCCENGCKIASWQVTRMVQAGIYACKGQKVNKNGKVTGTVEHNRAFGIHLWSIHSPTISLGQIAAEYIRQRRAGNLSDFFTNWLGLEYASRRRVPKWEELGRRFVGEYSRGEVVPDCWFITTGADCQQDRVKWLTVGWGHMLSHWIIDWGEVFRDETADIGVADDLMQFFHHLVKRSWRVTDGGKNPYGRTQVYNQLVGIDSNHRTMDVHTFVRWCNNKRVKALRGDHQVAPSEKYRLSKVERNSRTGEVYEGGLEQWGLYVSAFKSDLIERYHYRRGQPGAPNFPKGMLTEGKAVLQELVNEPPVIEEDRNGRKRVVYRPKSGTVPVDYWDGYVYARGLAEMIVDGFPGRPGWDSSKWPR